MGLLASTPVALMALVFIICAHANMLKGVFVLLCGMYVGKHYPQYVPLPKISKECTDKVLKFLEELQKKESGIK